MKTMNLTDLDTILDRGAAIALHQPLQSPLAEDAGQRLYPPTFPDLDGYFIDALPESGSRCIIDTKQSQARRLAKKLIEIDEAQPPGERFLPRVTVRGDAASRHVGEIGHRVADAAVLLSAGVGERAREAMTAYNQGDASLLGQWFPESLLFGFWDSHSLLDHKPTQVKRSRIIHSEIHAYGVSMVRSKSVYVAAAPALVSGEEYEADKESEKLSEAGLANAIGKTSRDGVLANSIARSAEINLAALRQIACQSDAGRTRELRGYLFHLALLALGWPDSDELNLRSGTLLVPQPDAAEWSVLLRDGSRAKLQMPDDIVALTRRAAQAWFGADGAPELEGVIAKGQVGKVRESLRGKGKGKGKAKAGAPAEAEAEAGE